MRRQIRETIMMARLIYSCIASLDGYVAHATGNFDWAEPDEEVHTFVNDLERPMRKAQAAVDCNICVARSPSDRHRMTRERGTS